MIDFYYTHTVPPWIPNLRKISYLIQLYRNKIFMSILSIFLFSHSAFFRFLPLWESIFCYFTLHSVRNPATAFIKNTPVTVNFQLVSVLYRQMNYLNIRAVHYAIRIGVVFFLEKGYSHSIAPARVHHPLNNGWWWIAANSALLILYIVLN